MGDSVKSEKEPRLKKFWTGVKAEYKKISWPDQNTLFKQSVAVVVI